MTTKTVLLAAGVVTLGGAILSATPLTAGVGESVATATEAAEGYGVDHVHSSVVFKIGYAGMANFYGRFNAVSGNYTLDFENPSDSILSISVPAGSVDSNNEERDKHLRSGDFFSAKEFPDIRFVGRTFEAIDSSTMRVTGDLTFHGVTNEETAEITWLGEGVDMRGKDRSGWEASLAIDRSAYGVNYGVENGALSDKVELTIAITGLKQ